METNLDGRDTVPSVSHVGGQSVSTEQEAVGLLLAQHQVLANSGGMETSIAPSKTIAIIHQQEKSDKEREKDVAAASIMVAVEPQEGTEGYQTVHTPLVSGDTMESVGVVNAAPVGTVFLEGDSSYEDVYDTAGNGKKLFTCRVEGCHKVFGTKDGMKSHVRTHTDERPHKCPHEECGKAFKTAGDLQKHLRRHTDGMSSDGKRQRSAVWHYFIKSENAGTSQCTVCSEIVKHANNTSNLFKHLKVKHPEQYQQAEKQREEGEEIAAKKRKSGSSKQTTIRFKALGVQRYPSDSTRRKNIDQAIVRMITVDMHPPSVVEDVGFQSLVQLLDPRYLLPSKKHVTNTLLPAVYSKRVEEMKQEIAQTSHVALSSELWTSGTTDRYLTISCHFFDSTWELKSLVLETLGFKRTPSTDAIAGSLRRIAQAWEISEKVVALVADDAANVVAAVESVGWTHVPCFANKLEQAVSEAVKADANVQELRNKCSRIVSFFHQSVKATEKLHEIQRQLGISEQELLTEVETRWTSTYHLFQRISDEYQAITTALCLSNGNELCLSSTDVDTLKDVTTVLKPFEATAREMCATHCFSMSKVIPLARSLEYLTSKITKELPLVCALKIQMRRHFANLESSHLLTMATMLDPRMKKLALYDAGTARQGEQKILQEMSELVPTDSNQGAQSTDSTAASGVWDFFDAQVAKSQSPKKGSSSAKLEAMKFFEEPVLRRSEDPLDWWRANEQDYQLLSQLAKKYLCIPGTSVPAERVFSKEGDLTASKRNRLKPKYVHMFLFLNKNL